MPLKNRVDPLKLLHAVPHRGKWLGNRGILHDRHGQIRWFHGDTKWVICELEFKGQRRELLKPGKYTELFFMDEATAIAAGHRPCHRCRRQSANIFLSLSEFSSFTELDAQLQKERMTSGPEVTDWTKLPNGAMIGWLAEAYMVFSGDLYHWSFDGYRKVMSIEADLAERAILKDTGSHGGGSDFSDFKVQVLTPSTSIRILEKGYPTQINMN